MASWTYLVRFTAVEDGEAYYTASTSALPQVGEKVSSFKSISTLGNEDVTSHVVTTIKEVTVSTH
jgi:hypothetical protein